MGSLTSGTIAGAGSFECNECGQVVTLTVGDTLAECPNCGGSAFSRFSLAQTSRFARDASRPTAADQAEWLGRTRASIPTPGQYVAFEDGPETVVVPLRNEWTRVGRSLAADIRFDDPTVS